MDIAMTNPIAAQALTIARAAAPELNFYRPQMHEGTVFLDSDVVGLELELDTMLDETSTPEEIEAAVHRALETYG